MDLKVFWHNGIAMGTVSGDDITADVNMKTGEVANIRVLRNGQYRIASRETRESVRTEVSRQFAMLQDVANKERENQRLKRRANLQAWLDAEEAADVREAERILSEIGPMPFTRKIEDAVKALGG